MPVPVKDLGAAEAEVYMEMAIGERKKVVGKKEKLERKKSVRKKEKLERKKSVRKKEKIERKKGVRKKKKIERKKGVREKEKIERKKGVREKEKIERKKGVERGGPFPPPFPLPFPLLPPIIVNVLCVWQCGDEMSVLFSLFCISLFSFSPFSRCSFPPVVCVWCSVSLY